MRFAALGQSGHLSRSDGANRAEHIDPHRPARGIPGTPLQGGYSLESLLPGHRLVRLSSSGFEHPFDRRPV